MYIVKTLVKTIKESRPDFLALITDRSRQYAEVIDAELRFDEIVYLIEILVNFDYFQEVFRTINRIFQNLYPQGFDRKDIKLNFTSGTKAMSSGRCFQPFKTSAAPSYTLPGKH